MKKLWSWTKKIDFVNVVAASLSVWQHIKWFRNNLKFICYLFWASFDWWLSVEGVVISSALTASEFRWITMVCVQITLLRCYFTLEITLGSKKNYTAIFAITNCQTLFDILILSLTDMKWKQYLPLLPLSASKY